MFSIVPNEPNEVGWHDHDFRLDGFYEGECYNGGTTDNVYTCQCVRNVRVDEEPRK